MAEDDTTSPAPKEVLILGNGISRKDHEEFIRQWQGPIWGCNWAYKELIEGNLPRLDRLLGDKIALKKAMPARKKHNLQFEAICKGHAIDELSECIPAEKLGVPRKKIFDSGTALVHLALIEGYDKIYLVGFDLGGRDIYIQNHESRNKSSWVRKWRMLRDEFGLDRLEFIGTDHKEFINSELPNDYYANIYMRGLDHLKYTPKEAERFHDDDIILENGKSRLQYAKYLRNWDREIWVCDNGFIEYNTLPVVHRVGTIQNQVAKEAINYKWKKNLDYAVFTRDFIKGYEDRHYLFQERRGWHSGPLLLAQALSEGYRNIYLAGFDVGKDDLYGKNVLKSSNYSNQLLTIKKENPDAFRERVRLMDSQDLKALFSQERT